MESGGGDRAVAMTVVSAVATAARGDEGDEDGGCPAPASSVRAAIGPSRGPIGPSAPPGASDDVAHSQPSLAAPPAVVPPSLADADAEESSDDELGPCATADAEHAKPDTLCGWRPRLSLSLSRIGERREESG